MLNSSHASSIVELPDGELFAVWYAPLKCGTNAVIWSSRRPVGSDRWTAPSILHYNPGYSNKNPVLYLGSDNKLFLFWAIEERWFKLVKNTVRLKTSDDLGRTWGEARDVSGLSWFLTRTHPIRLHNGDIILPVYSDLSASSAVAISKDGGLTWKGPKYILFFFGIQPTIIERSDLSLFTLMRCGMTPRLAWQATSNDSGKSWRDREYSNLNNPGTSLEMIKLNNGHVVLAFNDSKKDLKRLLLALSYDEGRTWPYKRAIEFETESPNTYPSLMQDRYGLIHLLYSYNGRKSIAHFVTDEEWIKGGKGSGYRQ
jgi:predicted neuraminidase